MNSLDLIQRQRIRGMVIELRGSRGLVIGDLLSGFDASAIFEEDGYS